MTAIHNPQLEYFAELGRERIKTMNIKYKLADHMRNSMHMPDDMLQHLAVYHLQHWKVPAFKNTLIDGTVDWTANSACPKTTYNVIYHQCTPAAAKSAKEIRLSFRKAKSEFGIEPYVLVQIVSQ